MSIDNFKPTIWSGLVLQELDKALIYAQPAIINRNYEGEISAFGDTVKINQIGDITVSDYVPNVTTIAYQELEDASKLLLINQRKYFAFNIDDVDAAQANVDLMSEAVRKSAYAIRDVADRFIAGKYTEASEDNALGSDGDPLLVTSTTVLDVMASAGQKLDEANVPTETRYMVAPPWFHNKLVLAKLVNENTSNEALTNGFVGDILGFNVFKSNNVPTVGDNSKITCGTQAAISYADQIVKIEALTQITSFGESVRGLHVYGAKVVLPDALCVVTAQAASEA